MSSNQQLIRLKYTSEDEIFYPENWGNPLPLVIEKQLEAGSSLRIPVRIVSLDEFPNSEDQEDLLSYTHYVIVEAHMADTVQQRVRERNVNAANPVP